MNPITRLRTMPAGVIGSRLRVVALSSLVVSLDAELVRVGYKRLDDGLIAGGCWHRGLARASTQAKGEALEAASRHGLRRPTRMEPRALDCSTGSPALTRRP